MTTTLDTDSLDRALATVHEAGLPGIAAEIRLDDCGWQGAAGVADLDSGRPMTADLHHRVGSITKTFTAAAVLQQVERGQVELDRPIGDYLPDLVPGERGRQISVRMLINHTSGLAEYLPYAYPSLAAFPVISRTTPESLQQNRLRQFDPSDLIGLGVAAPACGDPGSTPGTYSNTNYLLLGQLLERVTGIEAEMLITEEVIERCGLTDTYFPDGPDVRGPHSRLYESWFGMLEPPRDFSSFDMSWVGPAAALVSTVADLNRFFARLLEGKIIGTAMLTQMQRTLPVISFEQTMLDYGLGLHRKDMPGIGTFWGHDGSVWGGGAISMASPDGRRQLSVAINLQRWNRLDESGRPVPHPIDRALADFLQLGFGAVPS